MRLGLFSDVHANLVALEAVLADMPAVDRLVFVGDAVGYNASPAECVARIRETADVAVQGNHDRDVDTVGVYDHSPMAREGILHAREALSDDQRAWVQSLPGRRDLGALKVAHSHPSEGREDTYVRPEDFELMRIYLDDYDGLVLGHTHVQHAARVDGRLVVNPGSVGQPRDGDPRAAYAVVDTGDLTADLRRVAYDVALAQDRIRAAGLPERTAERLAEGV